MTPLYRSVKDHIKELVAEFKLDHRLKLRLGECTIEVRTNSRDNAEYLRSYFSEFLAEKQEPNIVVNAIEADSPEFDYHFIRKLPDPGKTKIKEEYVEFRDGRIVRKRLTGMMFLFNSSQNLAIGPCSKNLNQVINFVNNRYIQWLLLRGCLLGHAAGVVHGDRGIAIAGFSGMGKSTLALHLMSESMRFVSNDRLMIEDCNGALWMHGVPKHPRINPGTAINNEDLKEVLPQSEINRLESLSNDELWELEQKYDVIVDEVFGKDRFVLKAPMNSLIILNWTRIDEPAVIRNVDLFCRRDLLSAFIKGTGLFFYPGRRKRYLDFSEERYLELLSNCRVYEITGGVDFARATKDCLDIIESEDTTYAEH